MKLVRTDLSFCSQNSLNEKVYHIFLIVIFLTIYINSPFQMWVGLMILFFSELSAYEINFSSFFI